MRHEILLGAERRRRWSDEQKLEILAEVGRNGWSVADVARRRDLTRQHIYQWRRELRRKRLWPRADATTFLPVEVERSDIGAALLQNSAGDGFTLGIHTVRRAA